MTNKRMGKEELASLKARLAKRTRDEMDREWADPKFREEYAAWEREYRATVALYKARQKANLTQAELARRMKIPRANVSRIENGQNVTFETFARYLRGCGFDFSLRIFPLSDKASASAGSLMFA
jgi:ribosome-binding protein aMBF1 (putative translation factor)